MTASTSDTRWLTAEDLAAELRIPQQAIYKWRVEGFGPTAHKIGRHLRFSREDVDDWYSTMQEDADSE